MIRLEITSDISDIDYLIKSAINAEMKRLQIGLNRTNKEIMRLESKNRVLSDQFLTEYAAEDLEGGDNEYIIWMGELKIKEKIVEEINKLKEIEYVTKRLPV